MAKTILCVDDSVTMQKVAEITFDASDYTFVGARNADEGLAAARANRPDLILADAVMPGKTGYDLCKSIKDDADLASVPVLIMCGNSQAYDSARGTGVGADGHVVKPWDTQVMLDKVGEVLEGAGKPAEPSVPVAVPAASSAPNPKPIRAATPPPVPKPSMPTLKQPEPPRSATIMGMPSIKLPGSPGPGADFGAAKPVARPVVASAKTEPALPSLKPAALPSLKPTPPPVMAPPPKPISMPEPIKPVVTLKPPVSAPTAAPAPAPPAPSAKIPEMPRPPMIKGTPQRRPASIAALDSGAAAVALEAVPAPVPRPASAPTPIAPAIAARTEAAAAQVAASVGLDPAGPEMAAITKLSKEVIEKVVWEVVPDLAEVLIREHIAKNGLPR